MQGIMEETGGAKWNWALQNETRPANANSVSKVVVIADVVTDNVENNFVSTDDLSGNALMKPRLGSVWLFN